MNKQIAGDGTVGKALDILEVVASKRGPVRFTELREELGLPKATLHRFLQTLTNQRMISYDPNRQTYALGLRLVQFAHAAWEQTSLGPIARPFVSHLAQDTGETVRLAQLDAGQVIYQAKLNAEDPGNMFSQAGKVGPAFCTGVGKAIMAFMDKPDQDAAIAQQAFQMFTPNTLANADALRAELSEIRTTGVAYDREEHHMGLICIAVPVLNENGRAIAGLSVSTSTGRHALDTLDEFRPALCAAARNIADAAGAWQSPT